MWKAIYTHPAFPIVNVGLIIYGFPGMIEDWGVWQEWLTVAPWWSGFISGFGAAGLTFWALHVGGPAAAIIYKWIVALKKNPFKYPLVRIAYRSPGNSIQIAKLIKKARSVETAREIFDIFDGSPGKEKVADAYASYAQALVRFDCFAEATSVLMALDEQGIPAIDIEEAKDRFYYRHEDDEGTT